MRSLSRLVSLQEVVSSASVATEFL